MTARAALASAATAAIVASSGDLLLLWTAATTRPALGLPPAPAWALTLGLYAGVLAIPVYGLGWMALADLLAPAEPRRARLVRAAGLYAAALGSVIHGITGAALRVDLDRPATAIEPFALVERWGTMLLPLWGLATVLVVLASWLWARAAWRDAAGVPSWVAWTNPALGTVGLAALGAATALGRALVVPAAPNLAHVVFFLATTLRREPPRR